MSSVWLQNNRVLLDSLMRVMLCDACPCDTGTGTVTVCGLATDDLCLLVGGDGLGRASGGTGTGVGTGWAEDTGTSEPNQFWLSLRLRYSPSLGRWFAASTFNGSRFVSDASVTCCAPRTTGPYAFGGGFVPAFYYAYADAFCFGADRLSLQFFLTDICGVYPPPGGELAVNVDFYREGSFGVPAGAATFRDSPSFVSSVAESNNLFLQLVASGGGTPCGELTDTFNAVVSGCSHFAQTPRFLSVRAGNFSNLATTNYIAFQQLQAQSVGLLPYAGGCSWSSAAWSWSGPGGLSGWPNYKPCGSMTIALEDGRLTFTTEGYSDTPAAAYVIKFRQLPETGTGSGTGSGASRGDIWDQNCPVSLYYDGSTGSPVWGKDNSMLNPLDSSHYVIVQPHGGFDFAPCDTLLWPETLYVTFSSTCAALDGVVVALSRASAVFLLNSTFYENLFVAAYAATNDSRARINVYVYGVNSSSPAAEGGGMTATLVLQIACSGSALPAVGACDVRSSPNNGPGSLTLQLTSCDPFVMTTVSAVSLSNCDSLCAGTTFSATLSE